jgi:hypothetical protein
VFAVKVWWEAIERRKNTKSYCDFCEGLEESNIERNTDTECYVSVLRFWQMAK